MRGTYATVASGLGSVVRDYENRMSREYGRATPIPLHRLDDNSAHMRPDANDELLVLAGCQKHYVRQSRKDLKAGAVAPCTHPSDNGVCRGGIHL